MDRKYQFERRRNCSNRFTGKKLRHVYFVVVTQLLQYLYCALASFAFVPTWITRDENTSLSPMACATKDCAAIASEAVLGRKRDSTGAHLAAKAIHDSLQQWASQGGPGEVRSGLTRARYLCAPVRQPPTHRKKPAETAK